MNKRLVPIFVALAALLTASLACSVFSAELGLTNVHTAFDEKGEQVTSVFAPADAVYVVGDLANAPVGTVVKSKWYYVKVEGIEPNTLIDEADVTIDQDNFSGNVHFYFPAGSNWPVGDYAVEVYLNDQLIQSVPFSVK